MARPHRASRCSTLTARTQQGQTTRAVAELEAAVRLDPNDAESRQQLEQLQHPSEQ
jgi:Flp pilus assembly protein TadD